MEMINRDHQWVANPLCPWALSRSPSRAASRTGRTCAASEPAERSSMSIRVICTWLLSLSTPRLASAHAACCPREAHPQHRISMQQA